MLAFFTNKIDKLMAQALPTLEKESIHSYTATTIDGKSFSFEQLKGKKFMIVNTASKCGLTPQYEGLQELYKQYKDKNFTIIGFPANDFMKQEPGTNDDIAQFCQKNYGVDFQMMEKITVKGKEIHPVYEFLTTREQNGVRDSKVEWNFQKYLIDEQGHLADVISPTTKPMDKKIISWIEGAE